MCVKTHKSYDDPSLAQEIGLNVNFVRFELLDPFDTSDDNVDS